MIALDAATIAPYGYTASVDYELVIGDHRFRQLERVHAAHLGECPNETDDGLRCWRWVVRFAGEHGCESFGGMTSAEAVSRAASWVVTGRPETDEEFRARRAKRASESNSHDTSKGDESCESTFTPKK